MSTVLPQPRHRGFVRFAAGFGLGVAVVPTTLALRMLTGAGATLSWLLFLGLCAGALSVAPRSVDRVAGFVTGLVALVVVGIALVVHALSNAQFG